MIQVLNRKMFNLNAVANKILGLVQRQRRNPWLQWLLRILALSKAIAPVGWPESFPLKGT